MGKPTTFRLPVVLIWSILLLFADRQQGGHARPLTPGCWRFIGYGVPSLLQQYVSHKYGQKLNTMTAAVSFEISGGSGGQQDELKHQAGIIGIGYVGLWVHGAANI